MKKTMYNDKGDFLESLQFNPVYPKRMSTLSSQLSHKNKEKYKLKDKQSTQGFPEKVVVFNCISYQPS